MTILSDYQKLKAQETLDKLNKEMELKRNQYNRLKETTKTIPSIVDMKSAYDQVMKSNHIPTESEKRYRQFTSSELNIKN